MVSDTGSTASVTVPIPFLSDIVTVLVSKASCPIDRLPALAAVADYLGDKVTLEKTIARIEAISWMHPVVVTSLAPHLQTLLTQLTLRLCGAVPRADTCVLCDKTENLINLPTAFACNFHIHHVPLCLQLECAQVIQNVLDNHECPYITCPDAPCETTKRFLETRLGLKSSSLIMHRRISSITTAIQDLRDRVCSPHESEVDRRNRVLALDADANLSMPSLKAFVNSGKFRSSMNLWQMVAYCQAEHLVQDYGDPDLSLWATPTILKRLDAVSMIRQNINIRNLLKLLPENIVVDRATRFDAYARTNIDGLRALVECTAAVARLVPEGQCVHLNWPTTVISANVRACTFEGTVPVGLKPFWTWITDSGDITRGPECVSDCRKALALFQDNPVAGFPDTAAVIGNVSRYLRHVTLTQAMAKLGLVIRADSKLCHSYLSDGRSNPQAVAQRLAEMRFLFDYTEYASRRTAEFNRRVMAAQGFDEYDDDEDDEDDYYRYGHKRRYYYQPRRLYVNRKAVYDAIESKILAEIGGFPASWPWLQN